MLSRRVIPTLLVALFLAVMGFTVFEQATPAASYSISPLIPGTIPAPSPQAKIALRYLAKHSGQSTSNYLIVNEYYRSFPLLERDFRAFVIWDKAGKQLIDLLVDLDTGEVIDDIAALEQAEAELHRAENGKLHPDLFGQLQQGPDSIELFVGIWIEYDTRALNNHILAELALLHPEVKDAIYHGDGAFAIDDDELLRQLQKEYTQLWYAKVNALVQALAAELRGKGIDVQVTTHLPTLKVILTKEEIQDLSTRSDVQALILAQADNGMYDNPWIVDNIPFVSLSAAD